jgi:hypothetical protein
MIEIRSWIGHYIFGRLRDIQIFGPEKVTIFLIFYYNNKSKSQLTRPTPAQAASCCVISGTYSMYNG